MKEDPPLYGIEYWIIKDKSNKKEMTKMREFDSGATRDNEDDKFDYEGFLSPLVIERYGEYMHSHRKQADGEMRDSDNWQKGIPISVYMKSWWRHFENVWIKYRKFLVGDGPDFTLEAASGTELGHLSEALCAALFNNMGMLHEIEKERASRT